jgi:hypothetical protein
LGAARSLLLLDACCVINLYATGRMREILRALPYRCAAARYVIDREVLLLAPDSERSHERERIDLVLVIDEGLLEVMDVESDADKQELVRLAREIDDGEAQTCALARFRGASVASDDRKVLRLLDREQVTAVRTAELLHEWSLRAEPGAAIVRDALRRVEALASFRPRAGAPLSDWWRSASGR